MERNQLYRREVRTYRRRRGLTMPEYADALGASLRTIYRWFAGGAIQWRLWLDVARLHGVDPREPEALGFRIAGDPPTEDPVGVDSEDVDTMLRRNFLGVTAGAIFASELDGPVSRMLPRSSGVRMGTSDIARVVETRDHLHSVGHIVGSGALGREMLQKENRDGVRVLAGSFSSERLRRQAHTAVANLSCTVGWELFDLGHQDEARNVYIQGLVVVREAEPEYRTQIQTNILGNMAQQLIFLGRPQEALDLMGMVNGREHEISSLLRAWLATRRATATAALGKAAETHKHIGWAEEHINDAEDDRDHVWNVDGWFHEGMMYGNAGHAYATLAVGHQPYRDRCIDNMKTAIAQFPAGQLRDRARMQNSLTRLYAAAGDSDATVDAGMTAVATARRLRSPWVTRDLATVRKELGWMWAKPGVKDLGHEIDTLVRDTA